MFPISIIGAAASSMLTGHSSEQSNAMLRQHMRAQKRAYERSALGNELGNLSTAFTCEHFLTSRLHEWAIMEAENFPVDEPTAPVAPREFDASNWTGR